MESRPPQPLSPDAPTALPGRILDAARKVLFGTGPSALTMELLSKELGISKKTLYVHFPGKDAILCAIVDGFAAKIHERLETIVSNPNLRSPEKLCLLIETIGEATARLTPAILRDLERNAPVVFERIDAVRRRNIPYFFGRLIREGMSEGYIRSDVDPDFVCEFWLHAIRGLMSPEVMEKFKLSPGQTVERGVALFMSGLLTQSGRELYGAHVTKCRRVQHTI